jgi:DNA-binding transcriptional LysR family regulator
MVADPLARGSLIAVLEDHARSVPGLSLYYPSRSQSLPKLRAFIDFATRHLRPPGHMLPFGHGRTGPR